jgi:general secretion pathway protein F
MARHLVDNVTSAAGGGGGTQTSRATRAEAAARLRFLRQFSVKLKAGLSVDKCLAALSGEIRNRRVQLAVRDMHKVVVQGLPFSRAMRKHAGLFDECVVGLVEHGEQARKLRPVLASVIDYLDRRGGIEEALRRAVARPLNALALVLLATFVATVVMSFLVKAGVAGPATGANAAVSTLDIVASKVAHAVHLAWPFIGAFGLLCFVLLKLVPRLAATRAWLDTVALRLPLVAPAVHSAGLAIFFRTIGLRMQAGTPMPVAMRVAATTAPNRSMAERIAATIQRIEDNRPYIDALVADGFLRLGDVTAVQAAERRGDLGAVMLTLAGDRDREAAIDVKKLTALVDTVVVGTLGLVILAVMLTLYVPVFVAH